MKHILITGTSSGIGNFLAENLKYDFEITGVGRNENNITGIKYFQGDIKQEKFLKEISLKVEPLDYLIINAGIGYFDNFGELSIEKHKEIIDTNLTSPIILTSLLLGKIKSGIIFIGSISSKKSSKYGASYSASKFGLRGFAMNLKNELSSLKIHFINPKIVKTNFHKNSEVEIVGKFQESNIEDILKAIVDILEKREKRFEIDL